MRKFPHLNMPLIVTMLIWGFNFVAVKLVLSQMTPAAFLLVRYLLMSIVLVALCLLRRIPLRYKPGDHWRVLFQGFLAMGLYLMLFMQGMKDSSPAEGAILLATAPAFSLGIAVLSKQEAFRWKALGGMALAFSGVLVVIIFGHKSQTSSADEHLKLLGNLLVFGSAILWALSSVITKPLVGRYEPMQLLTLSMPGALPVVFAYGLVPALHAPYGSFCALTWWMLAFVVVLAGVGGFAMFYLGVNQVGASGAMTYQYLVPPLAAVFSWLLMGTRLSVFQLLGLGIVLSGVAVASSARQIPRNEPLPEISA